ncbi:MAG: TonB-dependent receptor [Bacteroidetes bacterium]|nr:TonB-dependent receptor [Bacteroidota bacterium]
MGNSTSVITTILIALVWAMVLSLPVLAQSGRIKGTVIDLELGDPLPGVEVYLLDTMIGVVTAHNGTFEISGVPAGDYVLEARHLGFESERRRIEVRSEASVKVTFSLRQATLEIPEIVIERSSMISSMTGIEGIPGSAHRLTTRMLEKSRHSDVNRILREIPGVNIIEEDGYGLRPNIGMRGTGSERSSKISLMEDGVLIAPAPYAAPAAYYFPSIGRMEEVEVRKGSSQIKYGPYTTGGALNLLSRRIPDRFSGMFHAMTGNNDDRTLHAYVGSSFDKGGFVAETYQIRTDGFKEIDTGGNSGFDKKDYLVKFRLNTDAHKKIQQAVSLKFTHTTEVSYETYLGLTDSDFQANPLRRYAASKRDVMNATHRQLVLRHVIQPLKWLQIATTGYRIDFSRNWYKLDKVKAAGSQEAVGIADLLSAPELHSAEYAVITGQSNGQDNLLNVKANNREYLSTGVQTEASFFFPAFGRKQRLDVGVRLHRDEMDRFQWVDRYAMIDGEMTLVDAGVPGTDSNRIEAARATAAFAQQNFVVGRLTLLPGVRYEHVTQKRKDYGKSDPERTASSLNTRENTVDAIIPGLGISFKFNSTVTLFTGIHKGFAPPGSTEGTRPESSVNYELGSRFRYGTFRADATVFFSDFSNLLGSDLAAIGGTGSFDQFNGGEVDVSGLEVSSTINLGGLMDWTLSIPVTMTYTYTSAVFQSNFKSSLSPWGTVQKGDELPYVPKHQISVGTGVEGRRYDIAVSTSYISAMRTQAGAEPISESERTDAHVVVDLSGSYSLTRYVRLFATVRNVTDAVYIVARRPAGLRPGLPRSVMAGITTTF